MEDNITDALKMAAAVLVFVIALGVSISSFSQARQTIDTLLTYQDREYDYTYVEKNGTTQRIIGAETIVPSIYKAYKENYKIVFKDIYGNGMALYHKSDGSGGTISVSSIDLEKDVLGSNEEKEIFIRALLYGSKYSSEIDNFKKSGIFLNKSNFYDTIKGRTFKEELGVYYQEEIQGQSDSPDVNKTKKRVITYTEI